MHRHPKSASTGEWLSKSKLFAHREWPIRLPRNGFWYLSSRTAVIYVRAHLATENVRWPSTCQIVQKPAQELANRNDSRTYSLVRVLSHPPISFACRSWKISEWMMHQRSLRMEIQISPSSVCHPSRFNLYHSVSRPSLPKTTATRVFVDGSSHLTSASGPLPLLRPRPSTLSSTPSCSPPNRPETKFIILRYFSFIFASGARPLCHHYSVLRYP